MDNMLHPSFDFVLICFDFIAKQYGWSMLCCEIQVIA